MNRIFITLLLIISFSAALSGAEKNGDKEISDVSIGINVNYGSFDLRMKNTDFDAKPGVNTGCGLSIEKRIYDKFWIGSGIQYRYFNTDFAAGKGSSTYDSTWTFQSINVPFLMILSLSGPMSAINFAGGVVYSHIFYSVMKTDTTMPVDTNRDNALKYIEANQIGLTAGIICKIKATEYTDFIFGLMGEYYPTNLLYEKDHSKDKFNMQNYSLTTGWMFRTNVF